MALKQSGDKVKCCIRQQCEDLSFYKALAAVKSPGANSSVEAARSRMC